MTGPARAGQGSTDPVAAGWACPRGWCFASGTPWRAEKRCRAVRAAKLFICKPLESSAFY